MKFAFVFAFLFACKSICLTFGEYVNPISSLFDYEKNASNLNSEGNEELLTPKSYYDLMETKDSFDYQLSNINVSKWNSSSFEKITTSRDLKRLKRKLLTNYDPYSRPLYSSSKAIEIGLSVGIIQINDLDPLYQVNFFHQINAQWPYHVERIVSYQIT